MESDIFKMYDRLYQYFVPQHWWPAESDFEIIVGAVLTQSTSWKNVEKALLPLRRKGLLTPQAIDHLPLERLAALIRPCGFYRVKAKRLKALVGWIVHQYGGSLDRMFSENPTRLRQELLAIRGIGPETADAILLYAGRFPLFVVDAYTRRIFSRHLLIDEQADYNQVQRFFMDRLPNEQKIFNEYHALIVETGKRFCKTRKTEAKCSECPLVNFHYIPP
ncbi:MAG: endonuclease III domain-containing protein [Candidatus Manganitrophaceae bacterium]